MSTSSRSITIEARNPDRKSTRLNSSHVAISYAVFCLKKQNENSSFRSSLIIVNCNSVLPCTSLLFALYVRRLPHCGFVSYGYFAQPPEPSCLIERDLF